MFTIEVNSETNPHVKYIVSQRDNMWRCTCMSFRYQKKRTCKHIEKLRDTNTLPPLIPYITWDVSQSPMKYSRMPEEVSTIWSKVLVSEKYDGYGTRWFRNELYTQHGNHIPNVPVTIRKYLEKHVDPEKDILECELLHPYRRSILSETLTGHWSHDDEIIVVIFDIVQLDTTFEQRWEYLKRQFAGSYHPRCYLAPQIEIQNEKQFATLKGWICEYGREGLVVKSKSSLWHTKGRHPDILKWKPIRFSSGRILKCLPKRIGMTLVIQEADDNGTIFQLYQHKTHWVPQQMIEFQYNGRTELGKPEFPRMVEDGFT